MANKEQILKTKIRLRYDSFDHWSKCTEPLLEGEIAVAYLGESVSKDEYLKTHPSHANTHPVMFKVGPGIFNDLPWASALAADVYGWAKKAQGAAEDIKVFESKYNSLNDKTVTAALDSLAGDIAALVGDGNGGSISELITEAINKLDYTDKAVEGEYVSAVSEVDGVISVSRKALPTYTLSTGAANGTVKLNDTEVAVAGLGSAAYKDESAFVASISNANASIAVSGDITAPQIAVALSTATDNAITLENDGLKVVIPNAAEYSIAKDSVAAEGYAATYHLTKDGANIGAAINIPKDMVVSSGSVVELNENDVEGLAAGTYIKLILANANNEELYIPVGSLIEYVTSGSQTGDMVFITIDETTHQVTATITDGTISFAKLDKDTQEKINKAGTVTSITAGDGLTGGIIDASGTIALDAEYVKNIKVNNAVNAEKSADSDKLGGKAASEYASKEQGEKAVAALQEIEAGTGLKVSTKADNKQTISIDEEVVFVLWGGDAEGWTANHNGNA